MAATITLAFLAGLAFGAAFFASLRPVVALYAAGRGPWVPALLQLTRLALLGLALFGGATLGAWPLLAMTAGVLLARAIVIRKR